MKASGEKLARHGVPLPVCLRPNRLRRGRRSPRDVSSRVRGRQTDFRKGYTPIVLLDPIRFFQRNLVSSHYFLITPFSHRKVRFFDKLKRLRLRSAVPGTNIMKDFTVLGNASEYGPPGEIVAFIHFLQHGLFFVVTQGLLQKAFTSSVKPSSE